ncbi:MAG: tRNA (guanosine(46)-N7)-methyltransferase TrmB [Lachnospiraceae bacterium]|nr:tRNA (guanosine(46)-N7)-methyltransferase TrmB [Lachnospiraceae bacterium]
MRLRNIPRANEVLATSQYVINNPKILSGKWIEEFGNNNPIYIEIGMGKGKFIIENAIKYPNINFIGIEKYSSVLLRAVEKMEDINPTIENLRFICIDAKELNEVFDPSEISKIYLNFSDPWPKAKHERRRLTSSDYLKLYHSFLKDNETLEFKTDNKILFDFSVEELDNSPYFNLEYVSYDLHKDIDEMKNNIMTEYEEKFSSMGNPIFKLIGRKSN